MFYVNENKQGNKFLSEYVYISFPTYFLKMIFYHGVTFNIQSSTMHITQRIDTNNCNTFIKQFCKSKDNI